MTIDDIRARVLECNSTTTFANAFRRALGIPTLLKKPETREIMSLETYEELDRFMRSNDSYVDRAQIRGF